MRKNRLLFILLAAGVLAAYFLFQKTSYTPAPTVKNSIVTKEQAIDNVKNLAEVKEYLKNVPGAIVEIDNQDENVYNIHVYEIKNGHTATFNWYEVAKTGGAPKPQF